LSSTGTADGSVHNWETSYTGTDVTEPEGERFIIHARPSVAVGRVLPDSRDLYSLYAYPLDTVGYTLSQLSALMGIEHYQHRLVLLEHQDGQYWALPSGNIMEEVVNRTGNATFMVDFD
jgi:hypothetical protein